MNLQAEERDLPITARVGLPGLKPVGDVQQVPTTNRLYTTGRVGGVQPAQVTVSWSVHGATPALARDQLDRLTVQLDTAARLYDGRLFLQVLRLEDGPAAVEGWGGLSWSGSHVFTLMDPYYHDYPNDFSARRTP
jgi:hypothetical protein